MARRKTRETEYGPDVGATSGKFVISGAVLRVQGRVDGHLAMLAIDPTATTSAIATQLAEELDPGDKHPHAFKIQIRGEFVTAAIAGRELTRSERADMRLGMDFLGTNPIVIDFARHSLHLIDNEQMRPVPNHYFRLNLGNDAG
jgi:hypothetical protein